MPKLYRPPSTIHNGCGLVAVAAFTGDKTEDLLAFLQPTGGRFFGTTTDEEVSMLRRRGVLIREECPARKRWKLRDYLPLDGCGVVAAQRGRRYHALAFCGKMVYDSCSAGRWMWVYDHQWATGSVRHVIHILEAA
jgi:hypothetical protein